MKALEGIIKSNTNGDDKISISRKIYLSYQTEIFKDSPDEEFYIKNSISKEFQIPFSTIQVCGSSKTGISFFKDKLFEPGKSDLDIAVLCLPLYNLFLEEAHKSTDGYSNLTVFPIFKGQRTDKQFINGLGRGYVNPFFMPNSDLRTKWLNFFLSLSNNYFKLFKSINGGVYSSEYFFEYKQKECIEIYLSNKAKYDKISNPI